MAKSGDRFEMPDGSVYTVLSPAEETGGEYVEMEFVFPPGSVSPPPHIHVGMSEEYDILEGRLDVMIDGDWITVEAGGSATVPPDTVHTFKNRSGATVRVRNRHRPPARFEDYIEHIYRVTRARGISSGKDPRIPIYLSMITLEYPETLAPGRTRERVLLKAMAGIGRMLRFDTAIG